MPTEAASIISGLGPISPSTILVEGPSPVSVARIIAALLAPNQAEAAAISAILGAAIAPTSIIVAGFSVASSTVSVARAVAALLNPGSLVSPGAIPNGHSGHITLSLTGANTAWLQGSTIFTPSGVSNVTKISQNVSSPTAATVVVTTGAGTGTLTITETVTGSATFTLPVAAASISLSPSSGATGTVPTVTVMGTNTVWTQEVSASLFTESGGTGASIGTITVATDTSAHFPLTVGSASGALTITDAPTSDTATFTATSVPDTFVFAGYASTPELTSAEILALQLSASQAGFAGTYNIVIPSGSNQYFYLAYPDSYGSVSSFVDGNTGFPLSMAAVGDDGAYSNTANGWYYALVSVVNPGYATANYRVYRSQYSFNASTIKMVVS